MDNVNVHYHNSKNGSNIEVPFATNFLNGFNETLNLNVEYRGSDANFLNSLKLKSPPKLTLKPFEATSIQGEIKVSIPNKSDKSILSISST
jgi:hypothetical protein